MFGGEEDRREGESEDCLYREQHIDVKSPRMAVDFRGLRQYITFGVVVFQLPAKRFRTLKKFPLCDD